MVYRALGLHGDIYKDLGRGLHGDIYKDLERGGAISET
jgi:hypothetical protein